MSDYTEAEIRRSQRLLASLLGIRTCGYCETDIGLRVVHHGCGSEPAEYVCEHCFAPTDTGPTWDDLEEVKT